MIAGYLGTVDMREMGSTKYSTVQICMQNIRISKNITRKSMGRVELQSYHKCYTGMGWVIFMLEGGGNQ